MTLPILYSFRRCPYAMRARFALSYARVTCVLREIDLKHKPEALIMLSPKATVPVLLLANGDVIDQSIAIVEWALVQKGEVPLTPLHERAAQEMVRANDSDFVKILHRYKYRIRYPEHEFQPNEEKLYRSFAALDKKLNTHQFLLGDTITKADIALFPFVRQAVLIEPEKFARPSLKHVMRWLNYFLHDAHFVHAMTKYPVWLPGDADTIFCFTDA